MLPEATTGIHGVAAVLQKQVTAPPSKTPGRGLKGRKCENKSSAKNECATPAPVMVREDVGMESAGLAKEKKKERTEVGLRKEGTPPVKAKGKRSGT